MLVRLSNYLWRMTDPFRSPPKLRMLPMPPAPIAKDSRAHKAPAAINANTTRPQHQDRREAWGESRGVRQRVVGRGGGEEEWGGWRVKFISMGLCLREVVGSILINKFYKCTHV